MLKRRRHNYSFCFVLFLFCTKLFVLFIAFFCCCYLFAKKNKKLNYRLKQTILQTSTSSIYKKLTPSHVWPQSTSNKFSIDFPLIREKIFFTLFARALLSVTCFSVPTRYIYLLLFYIDHTCTESLLFLCRFNRGLFIYLKMSLYSCI